MEPDLGAEVPSCFKVGFATAPGVVHVVVAFPGEGDAMGAEVSIQPALDSPEGEFATAVRLEPDVAGSEEVAKHGVPEFHVGEPLLAELLVSRRGHDKVDPRTVLLPTQLPPANHAPAAFLLGDALTSRAFARMPDARVQREVG
jgi:hypothetical protein